MPNIIAFAGKKGSGKNTAANFIIGLHLLATGVVKNNFSILDDGKLFITDILGDSAHEGIFDITRGTPEMSLFLAEHLDPYLKIYSFADLLKSEVCMKILGLTYEQCYGTDEQKNALTNLKWEDMPGVITNKLMFDALTKEMQRCVSEYDNWEEYEDKNFVLTYHEPGQMSSREIMQFVGTNLFRKMYGNVWVDALMRRINDENPSLAIITDCRFPNEVVGVQKVGGKVVRLTRNPYVDNHMSEVALDGFTDSQFDYVINNKDMSIKEQNDATYKMLNEWKLLPIELEEYASQN